MLASKIFDLTSSYIFWYNGHPKTQKNVFFRISHNYWPFWCRRPNMGSTMRKLTSRRFQKCGTYRFFQFLNGSYGCSKSAESEIFDLSPKLCCVTKNCNFWTRHLYASKRIGSHVYPIDMMYYSFRSAQMPHSKVLVFCNETKPWNFLLTFDATLGSKKYGANYLYPHVSYIFGKPWACSSTWWNPGWVILLENFE